jgi:hypothetical protein
MDRLYRSNAESVEHIHAVIFSDDVSADDSIDDWTESDRGYVQARGEEVTRSVQKMLGQMIIATMKWTVPPVVFIGTDKTQRGKVKRSTHMPRRWQNILTRIPGVIGHARNAIRNMELSH